MESRNKTTQTNADEGAPLPITQEAPLPITLVDPVTRVWLQNTAAPADVALALDLGSRCVNALGLKGSKGSSSALGSRGEEKVFELLQRTRRVRDVSRSAHSADLICDSRAGAVYVEVKHYTSNVPSAEIDKFLRDLRERDAPAGVFLSLTSSIVGQRASISVVLEPRVSTGTLVPVVYAAPPRDGSSGGVLDPSVAIAAVDMAICLAEVYPRGTNGLHGRDTMTAYAVAAEQLADGAADVRTDLARLSSSISDDVSSLGARLVSLGREARTLARGQRAEIEEIREVKDETSCDDIVEHFCEKYTVQASKENLLTVVLAIEQSTGVLAGILGEENRWRLLKYRAIHIHSGTSFSFLKSATEVRVPLSRITETIIAKLIKTHVKKVRLADGEIAIAIDDDTLQDALKLVE